MLYCLPILIQKKPKNIYHGYDKVAYYIGGGSQPTVFVLWEFYIQNGVLGGYVNRSYQLGIQAVKIIGNQLPKALHVSLIAEKLTGPVFDYRAILKHNLNESQLPPDAIIRGKPESIIHQNIYILMLSGNNYWDTDPDYIHSDTSFEAASDR